MAAVTKIETFQELLNNPVEATFIRNCLEQTYQGFTIGATIPLANWVDVIGKANLAIAGKANRGIKGIDMTKDESLKEIAILHSKLVTVVSMIESQQGLFSRFAFSGLFISIIPTFFFTVELLDKKSRILGLNTKSLQALVAFFASASVFTVISYGKVSILQGKVTKLQMECRNQIVKMGNIRQALNTMINFNN